MKDSSRAQRALGCGSAGWVGQEDKELRELQRGSSGDLDRRGDVTAVGMSKGLQA